MLREEPCFRIPGHGEVLWKLAPKWYTSSRRASLMMKALQRAIVKALSSALTRLPLGRCGCEMAEGVWCKWQGSNYMVLNSKNFGHHQWQIYDC